MVPLLVPKHHDFPVKKQIKTPTLNIWPKIKWIKTVRSDKIISELICDIEVDTFI